MSVALDRLIGLSPLLCRFGPMITFSKAHTIFSKLLALCLAGMDTTLVGVVADADPLVVVVDDVTGTSVSTTFDESKQVLTNVFSLSSIGFNGIRTGWVVSFLDGVLGIVGVVSPDRGNSSKLNLPRAVVG